MRRTLILVQAVGVHHRMGEGEQGGAFVMIDDHHFDPCGVRGGEWFERLGAAIDGDDQVRTLRLQAKQGGLGRAIALRQAVWDVCARR